MKEKFELYGYVIESRNDSIGPRTREYLGEYWSRYNRKVYNTEEDARKAWEENPYKHSDSGFMAGYKIVPIYTKIGQVKTKIKKKRKIYLKYLFKRIRNVVIRENIKTTPSRRDYNLIHDEENARIIVKQK